MIIKATLHEISKIMGLPGKPKGFDGGEVERYFHEGKIKDIVDYCETDVVGTYQVWLRYELFRGTLSQNAFEASQRNLADFMNGRLNIKEVPLGASHLDPSYLAYRIPASPSLGARVAELTGRPVFCVSVCS